MSLNYAPVDELDRWMHRRGVDPRQAALSPSAEGTSAPPADNSDSTPAPM